MTAATLLLTLECAAAKPPKPQAAETQKTVARLIADLDSDKYAVRLQASRKLSRMGQPVVDPLAKAAEQGSLEVAIRAISLLEVYFIGEKEAVAEEAESAFEHLAASKNRAVARRAQSVLAAHQDVRQERALAAFVKLGGIRRPLSRVPKGEMPFLLQIGSSWKGGDEGLKYVKRLPNLMHLYRIDGNNISEKAWEDLAVAMPLLKIHHRGPAFLGIRGDAIHRGGCLIGEVTPESAAEKGGIRKGDVITSLAGKKVSDFDTLIAIIQNNKAGDKVAIEVLRGGKPVTLQVVLGGWK